MVLTLGLSSGVWGAILWPRKERSPTLHAVQGVAYNYQPNGIRPGKAFTIYKPFPFGNFALSGPDKARRYLFVIKCDLRKEAVDFEAVADI